MRHSVCPYLVIPATRLGTSRRLPATQDARVLQNRSPRNQRAQGMPGARPHPQPCVRNEKSTQAKSLQVVASTDIPCANGFSGFLRALPGDRAFLSPSQATMRSIAACLISASRYQDHTTSPSAVQVRSSAHRKRPSAALRHIGTTGKSPDAVKSVSSVEQLLRSATAFHGRPRMRGDDIGLR